MGDSMERIKGKRLMTLAEVAALLNVKTSWMRNAVFRKEIPYIKVGRHVRFREEDIVDWVGKNKILQG